MKIYFHIGAGKTGTTSIQQYLKFNTAVLHEQGVFYAGMSFERLGKDKSWKQKVNGYSKLSNTEFTQELLEAIDTYVEHCKVNELHTLVVSNESFSGHIHKFMDLFNIVNKQHELKIIHYIRQPESWLISAYQQWGIKHKVKKGPIVSAKNFIASNKQNNMLKPLIVMKNKGFTNNIIARNLEACKNKDVVADFCDIVGINYTGVKVVNQKLNDFEELFYFMVNNQEASPQSSRRAKAKLKSFENQANANKILTTINVKAEYFDAKRMVAFKKSANKFLDKTSQFEETFTPKQKTNTLDYRIVNFIERYLYLEKKIDAPDGTVPPLNLQVDELFAGAVQLETVNLGQSKKLMLAAQLLRPNGPKIKNKIQQYDDALKQGVIRFEPPKRSILTVIKRYCASKLD